MEYVLILVWIGFMALIARTMKFKRMVLVDGIEEERYLLTFALVAFLPILFMASNRGWFWDTGTYMRAFESMPNSVSEIPSYLSRTEKDKGFAVLSIIIKAVFGSDVTLYLFVIAAIQGLIVANFFRKYSVNYFVSVFLFVASSDYLSWMFNGIRQFMAVVIILLAVPLILKKRWIWSILFILLASTMHQSALIMIPIIFIAQGQAWNTKTVVLIFIAIGILFFTARFTNFLDDSLSGTQYKNVVTDFTRAGDDGTNSLRVAVYCVPAVISFFGRKKIRESNNALINVCTNMSVISGGLYLISMVTSGVYIGRLPIYCSLFGYILLPWEIQNILKENIRPYIYASMIILYIVFYYIQIHSVWGLI